MDIKRFVGRSKLRFSYGSNIFGIFISIMTVLTFAKVWQSTFEYYGVPMIIVYIGFPLLFVLGCWYAGFLYDTLGFWKEEIRHANTELNDEFVEQCRDIKEIKQMLVKK